MQRRRAAILSRHLAAGETLHGLVTSLPLKEANRIIDGALEAGRSRQFLPLCVAVLDAGGHLIAMKREDGCGIMRGDIAFGKAWGSLSMGMSSRTLRDRLHERPTFMNALASVSQGRWVPGGVLVLRDGAVVGAVGVSGDTSEKDELCAIEGIKTTSFHSEPSAPSESWQASSLGGH